MVGGTPVPGASVRARPSRVPMPRIPARSAVLPAALALALPLEGCALFRGCVNPDLPSDSDKPNQDSPPADTGPEDTAVDTAPPPPCDAPEVEPNNTQADAQAIELDDWACGVLDEPADLDTLRFETTEGGWLRAWARGADIGSSADLQLYLVDEGNDNRALTLAQRDSTDPLLVVPVDEADTWYAVISDQYYTYSDDHIWEFAASMAKAPVDWDVSEEEPNGSMDEGNLLEPPVRVYGVLSEGSDRDWFRFEVPDTPSGKAAITIRVDAWRYGSPLDARVKLYDPSGQKQTGSGHGETTTDFDPLVEWTATEPGEWGVLIYSDDGVGSPLYWYVIDIEVDADADTGG